MQYTTRKVLIIVAASLTVVVVGWITLVGSLLAWGGVATVRFADESGQKVAVPIPMAVVEAAVASSDILIDPERFALEADLGEWTPMVREVLEALDECPDAVLVEIEDGDDHVRVEKRGGYLVVAVDDGEIDLEVRVPTRSVRRTVARLVS